MFEERGPDPGVLRERRLTSGRDRDAGSRDDHDLLLSPQGVEQALKLGLGSVVAVVEV